MKKVIPEPAALDRGMFYAQVFHFFSSFSKLTILRLALVGFGKNIDWMTMEKGLEEAKKR